VVSKPTVLDLLDQGLDYHEISRRTGVSAGTAYLIATGMPADGGDSYTQEMRERPGAFQSRSQLLVHTAEHNPTKKPEVLAWVKGRVAADAQMRSARHATQS